MSSDLHARLVEAVNARMELARTVHDRYPGPWSPDDPATVIRHCERDLRVLERHQPVPAGVKCDCRDVLCTCGEHVLWPCDDLVWLATAYGIEVPDVD